MDSKYIKVNIITSQIEAIVLFAQKRKSKEQKLSVFDLRFKKAKP
jgi:hypothetical protein